MNNNSNVWLFRVILRCFSYILSFDSQADSGLTFLSLVRTAKFKEVSGLTGSREV